MSHSAQPVMACIDTQSKYMELIFCLLKSLLLKGLKYDSLKYLLKTLVLIEFVGNLKYISKITFVKWIVHWIPCLQNLVYSLASF